MKTMKELCQRALDCQDAVNLSGVVHSFSAVMTDLRAHLSKLPDFSTDMLNHHPVSRMYSSKIASLTGSEVGLEFSHAYQACQDMVNCNTEGCQDCAHASTPAEEAELSADQTRAEINANTQ